MLLHLKKISGSNASLFSIGYEVVGIPVDENGDEMKNVDSLQQLHMKLPSTRFSDRPFQFSDGPILKITGSNIHTNVSVWNFTIVG